MAYGEGRPGDVLKPLGLRSSSLVVTAEVAHPLIRMRRRNLTLVGGLESVSQETSLGGVIKLIDDELRVAYVRLDGQAVRYWGPRPIQIDAQVGLRQGISGLGASDRGDPLLSRFEARPNALVAFGQASVLAIINPKLAFSAQLEGQYARRPLAAYSEYAVGALTIGRGYDPGFVSGDSALAASFDLITNIVSFGRYWMKVKDR